MSMRWREIIGVLVLGVVVLLWRRDVATLQASIDAMKERVTDLEDYRDSVPAIFRVELIDHERRIKDWLEVRLGKR